MKATTTGAVQGVSLKRKSTPTFWGDDPVNGDGDVPGTVNDYGDDWIIDDIGTGMEDDHAERRVADGDGFVKEMGMFLQITCCSCSGESGSEHHKGTASFSTRVNADGWQETVPW